MKAALVGVGLAGAVYLLVMAIAMAGIRWNRQSGDDDDGTWTIMDLGTGQEVRVATEGGVPSALAALREVANHFDVEDGARQRALAYEAGIGAATAAPWEPPTDDDDDDPDALAQRRATLDLWHTVMGAHTAAWVEAAAERTPRGEP